jgi:phospholipid/cholesterol/gamma-HCH transport system substrate-binding protein
MARRSATAVRREIVWLSVFTVISLLVLAVLAIQLSGSQLTAQNGYQAQFANTSGLKTGDEVVIAGVQAGRVTSVNLRDNAPVVGFTVDRSVPLPADTHATVVYKDLLGNLYLQLSQGGGSQNQGQTGTDAARTLAPGATIPVSQTTPALDLDSLLGGFQPLFQGLQPTQINQLSTELISVLQGQGGTIDDLLAQIGSLTNSLADRTTVIDGVIDNLNSVLTTVNQHGSQFSTTLGRLQQLITGLSDNRQVIGSSIGTIGSLAGSFAQMLDQARPALKTDIGQFNQVVTSLAQGDKELNFDLQQLPQFYSTSGFGGIGIDGSFTNVYLCGLRIESTGAGGENTFTPWIKSNSQTTRCKM